MNRARGRERETFDQIRQEINKGQRQPFYLLYGEEAFERDEAWRWLSEHLAPTQARDFNYDVFRGDEVSAPALLGVYCAYPVLANHRLIVLREADKLSAEACKALEAVVDHPVDSSILVVVGTKVDLRRRLYRELSAKGKAIEFRPPFDNQIGAWLRRYAQGRGLQLDADAADLLHSCVGSNLRELAGELAKLALLAGDDRRVSRRLVEVATGGARQAGVFQLTDALGRREGPRALALTRQLLAQGEEPPRILAMVLRHFQLLARARQLLEQRVPPEQMAGELGVSPFFLKSYVEQARAFPAAALWDCLSALLQADSRLKSLGRRQEALVLELLVTRLAPV